MGDAFSGKKSFADTVRPAFNFFSFCIFFYCATFTVLSVNPVLAQNVSQGHLNSITFHWENDVFAGTDRDYTNGLRLTWSKHLKSAGDELDPDSFLNHLPFDLLSPVKDPGANLTFALSLGQSIYTPVDTRREELIEHDRPYAGYLYVGMGLHAYRGRRLTLLELDLGVIGPMALGEELQNTSHRVVGSDIAAGWDNQLDNEPALQLIYKTKWRLWDWHSLNGFGMGLIPHVGGRLGTVHIDADAGAEFRFGWYLPDNFGSCPIRNGCDTNHLVDLNPRFGKFRSNFSVHLFVGTQGYLVLRDTFLDGNIFSSSHSVDKKLWVGEAMTGIAFHYKRFRAVYAYVWRSRQFEQQEDAPVFGSFTFSFDY